MSPTHMNAEAYGAQATHALDEKLDDHKLISGPRPEVLSPPAHLLCASVEMRVDTLVEQIRGCSVFFESQLALLDAAQVQETVAAMCTSLKVQIQNLTSLDVSGAATLNQVIANSKFPATSKSALAAAVASKATSSQGPQLARRTTQQMSNVCAYFTSSDWNIFIDADVLLQKKVLTLIERSHNMGLQHPSEKTIASFVALLACWVCWGLYSTPDETGPPCPCELF